MQLQLLTSKRKIRHWNIKIMTPASTYFIQVKKIMTLLNGLEEGNEEILVRKIQA
jgi:hypothetical protein